MVSVFEGRGNRRDENQYPGGLFLEKVSGEMGKEDSSGFMIFL
jgi:hypothetical protein